MKRFKPQTLEKTTETKVIIAVATVTRIILTPVFLLIRLYRWVWDYDYTK